MDPRTPIAEPMPTNRTAKQRAMSAGITERTERYLKATIATPSGATQMKDMKPNGSRDQKEPQISSSKHHVLESDMIHGHDESNRPKAAEGAASRAIREMSDDPKDDKLSEKKDKLAESGGKVKSPIRSQFIRPMDQTDGNVVNSTHEAPASSRPQV